MTTSAVLPNQRTSTQYRQLRQVGSVILVTALAVVSVAMFYPFLWLFFSSFKTAADIVTLPVQLLPREWTLSAFEMVLNQTSLPRAYVNSLGLTAAIVLSVLFTSSLGGFVFARLEFPGRDVIFVFILATTMIPFVTLLIPLYLVMQKLGVLNTYLAVFIPAAVSSFGIFLCRQFVFNIPRDLYDAAKIDGCSDFRTYTQISVPLMKPVISALAIFTFLGAFNSYLWPLVVLNDERLFTLPLILAKVSNSFGTTNYQGVMAGSLLACIPTLLVYLIFQRNFVRGIALSGIKG